jgi:carbon storage regulator
VLVLTRKVGDVIAIGDNIKIVVMAIKGKQVRLGVQADRNTVVHREEIYQKIQQETRAALQNDMVTARAAGELLKESTDAREGGADKPRSRSSSGFVVRRAPPTPAEPRGFDDDGGGGVDDGDDDVGFAERTEGSPTGTHRKPR